MLEKEYQTMKKKPQKPENRRKKECNATNESARETGTRKKKKKPKQRAHTRCPRKREKEEKKVGGRDEQQPNEIKTKASSVL